MIILLPFCDNWNSYPGKSIYVYQLSHMPLRLPSSPTHRFVYALRRVINATARKCDFYHYHSSIILCVAYMRTVK